MRITYANKRVERYFSDYAVMKKKISPEWVRTIKKFVSYLIAADNFGIFKSLGLGHLEQLSGKDKGKYSVRISGNVRMVIRPLVDEGSIEICEVVEMEGVVDYHGGKCTWYIH